VIQAKSAQKELGQRVRRMLEGRGIVSVAAAGYQVVVLVEVVVVMVEVAVVMVEVVVEVMLNIMNALCMIHQSTQAPSVVVSYTSNPDIKTGKAFADIGIQIAAGVPLQVSANHFDLLF
jgi:hypothetical protein